MPIPTYTLTCLSNSPITHDVHELRFTKPEDFSFVPGQFVMLQVPSADNPSDIQPRAYSIASTPDEQDLRLAIKIRTGGRAGEWVKNVLTDGAEVEVQGPLGVFGLLQESDKDILFLCTGVGLAPFRPMILEELKKANPRRMDLIIGVCKAVDYLWEEELKNLASKYKNFNVHVTLSEPDSDWNGLTGYIQDVVLDAVPDFRERSIYACGNPVMTKAVKEIAINKWGIEKGEFHMEGYI